jgi:glutathione S-transferase
MKLYMHAGACSLSPHIVCRELGLPVAIVQYLADLRPEAGLAPPHGTAARTRLQTWLNFITSELHKPMAMLFDPAMAPVRDALLARIGKRLGWLSREMAGPFLLGDRFTVADAYLFVCLNWSPFNGVDLAQWPTLTAFMARVGARPAVQEALAAEGLVRTGDGVFFAPGAQS